MTTTRTSTASPDTTSTSSGSAWPLVLGIVGALLLLGSATLLSIGGVGLWADHQRGDDGFFASGPERLTTDSFALTVPALDVNGSGPDVFYTEDLLGEVRIEVEPSDGDSSTFVGIGPADDVANYLASTSHTEISDVEIDPFRVYYTPHPGGRPAADPAEQNFWVASDGGSGTREVTWDVASGDWAVVVMNADSARTVDVDVSAAATLPAIRGIAIGALIGGGLAGILGLGVIVLAFSVRGRRSQPREPAPVLEDGSSKR
jgi:hypothetical protein